MRATDATQFLSTAAVLFTIFLTVAAGALISGLPHHPADLVDDPDPGIEQGFARAIRSMLVDLVVLNALGVLLPFTCLFVGVFTRLPTWLVIVCFAYTVMVFLTNLAAVLMVKLAPQLYDKAMRRRGPGPSEGYL